MLTGAQRGLVETAQDLSPLHRVLLPLLGGLAAGTVLWLERRRYGRGIGGDYMESLAIGDGKIGFRRTFARCFSSLLSISSGGSVGREGAMVQLSAMLASLLSRSGMRTLPSRRLLVACGAAAGIASAYNAPVSGALFVAEIILGSIAMESFGPLLVAAVIANLTIHHFLGYRPIFFVSSFPETTTGQIGLYLGIGLVVGLLAPLFLVLIARTKSRVESVQVPLPVKLAIGGGIVGLLSLFEPNVWGNGYGVTNRILGGEFFSARALCFLLLFKVAATTATVGSGAIGGVFTPTLFVGAALGALGGEGLATWMPHSTPPVTAMTAVAMGAFLAATTQAPLTSILMVFEMTGTSRVILPLMLACVPAYAVVRVLGVKSLYAQEKPPPRGLEQRSLAPLIRPNPPTVRPHDTLHTLAEQFAVHRFQFLYVTDENLQYLGAVSLHQLLTIADTHPEQMDRPAETLLDRQLPILTPEMPIEQALTQFARHHGERLPVVDAQGRLVGAVGKTDVLLDLRDALSGGAPLATRNS